MELQIALSDFLAIGIVGATLSLAIQYFKNKWGVEAWLTRGLTVFLALGIGAGYWVIRDTAYFPTVVGILTSASTVWALFLKQSN